MKADVKKMWVEDLRAHPELQGEKLLKSTDETKFCCLGRLCELAKSQGVELPDWYLENDINELETSQLPASVMEWADIAERPHFFKKGASLFDETYFDFLNDTGSTFAEIADLIEAHL